MGAKQRSRRFEPNVRFVGILNSRVVYIFMPVAGLKRDDLHFSRLTVQTQILQPTPVRAVLLPGQVPQAPQALDPEAVARIYAGAVKLGFKSLQEVPGGAQMVGSDASAMVLVATANSFQFSEDLSKSTWQHTVERLEMAVGLYAHEITPGSFVLQQLVDLHAFWENLGQSADTYIAARFLKSGFERLVDDFGYNFNGAGIRLSVVKPVQAILPPGAIIGGTAGISDGIDVRIEPLFADKSRLFVQVTGIFAPTQDIKEIARRAQLIHEITWDRLARNMTLEVN